MKKTLTRRAVLKGLGASVTLPWLDSLVWRRAKAESISQSEVRSAQPPTRYGVVLFANGVNPYEWWASGSGGELDLSSPLQPLMPFRQSLTVLKGLHVFNNTSGPHWPLFSNYLNGATFSKSLIPEGAQSIDQLIARKTGKETLIPSLVLGVEPAETGLRGGVPSVYYGTISWSSKNTPVPPDIYPRSVFDRLFDRSGLELNRSVLDAVLEQSKDVRRRLGRLDQGKLDEYMESVRELELRMERAASDQRLEGWRPSLREPNIPRPQEALPQDVADHMRMMLDLTLLAWQMDKTRVITLLLNRDVSHMKFGFLEGVLNEQLHNISHHKEDKDKLRSYTRINQFHVEQFAYLLKKMQQVQEAEGRSLLDHSILQFGSNMFNGDSHDGRDLPMILAGHGNGALRGGQVIDVSSRPEEEQRACNLYASLARIMGTPVDRFGDSVGELGGLA